jgi:hypothetical protein
MKPTLLLLLLLGAFSIRAEEVKNNTLVHLGESKISSDEKQKARVAAEKLLERTLLLHMISLLEEKGFNEESVRRLVQSSEYKGFSDRVVRDPKVTQVIESVIERLMASPTEVASMTGSDAAQAREYAMKKYLLENSLSFSDHRLKPHQGLLARAWSEAQRYLFE